ncbi:MULTISPECIES: hypothetical protein [Acetobacteraceae]|uniref:hypothetical protein n=1 Tax=Acetobacteraceae TaxID=433 RepID=UPI001F54A6A0|nr:MULTISPECIES: hypothetical protein [Acetobacteraceae]GBQ70386.1 hypothetical protein AA15237_0856 [Komagataeibacter xylinus NBRC 15237]
MFATYAAIMRKNASSSESRASEMAGARLLLCITTLGWSERQAAEYCQMHRTAFRRCVEGTSRLAPDLAEWLLAREAAARALPCPRRRENDPVLRELMAATLPRPTSGNPVARG